MIRWPMGVALSFIREYAEGHPYFTGGDILAAWRESGHTLATLNWRNKWGVAIQQGHRAGWYSRIAKVPPTTTQSHTFALALWRSNVFPGPMPAPEESARTYCRQLYFQIAKHEIKVDEALWKAYEFGKVFRLTG